MTFFKIISLIRESEMLSIISTFVQSQVHLALTLSLVLYGFCTYGRGGKSILICKTKIKNNFKESC